MTNRMFLFMCAALACASEGAAYTVPCEQFDVSKVLRGKGEASVPGHATHLVRLYPCRCGRLCDDVVDIRDAAWRLLREKDLSH